MVRESHEVVAPRQERGRVAVPRSVKHPVGVRHFRVPGGIQHNGDVREAAPGRCVHPLNASKYLKVETTQIEGGVGWSRVGIKRAEGGVASRWRRGGDGVGYAFMHVRGFVDEGG